MSRGRKVLVIFLVSLSTYVSFSMFQPESTSKTLNNVVNDYFLGSTNPINVDVRSQDLADLQSNPKHKAQSDIRNSRMTDGDKLDQEIKQLIESIDNMKRNEPKKLSVGKFKVPIKNHIGVDMPNKINMDNRVAPLRTNKLEQKNELSKSDLTNSFINNQPGLESINSIHNEENKTLSDREPIQVKRDPLIIPPQIDVNNKPKSDSAVDNTNREGRFQISKRSKSDKTIFNIDMRHSIKISASRRDDDTEVDSNNNKEEVDSNKEQIFAEAHSIRDYIRKKLRKKTQLIKVKEPVEDTIELPEHHFNAKGDLIEFNIPGMNPHGMVKEKRYVMMNGKRREILNYYPIVNTGQTNRTFQIILNPDICNSRNLSLVLCVEISRDNFEGRKTIRETWGSFGRVENGPIALVFFLGSAKAGENPKVQLEIQTEFEQYNDIVMASFIDDYKNLTLKSLSIIKWVTEFCRNTDYILKADDDVYINVPFLEYVLRNTSDYMDNKPFIIGVRNGGVRPIRYMNHKWYVSSREYKDNYYPPYVDGGGGYAMTSSAAIKINEIASFVRYVSMEDVFITGLCSRRASIKLIGDDRFSSHKLKVSGLRFLYQVSGSQYSAAEIRTIHAKFITLSPVKYGYSHLVGRTPEEISVAYEEIMKQEDEVRSERELWHKTKF